MPHAPAPSSKLLIRIKTDYPEIHFVRGANDRWDSHATIYYTAATPDYALLHELAHALLAHADYQLDIDLLRMERAAWDYARKVLSPKYDVPITEEDAEGALDTYRNWLHNRSLCPDCHLSSLQQSTGEYRCIACRLTWRANAAKTSALRRTKVIV